MRGDATDAESRGGGLDVDGLETGYLGWNRIGWLRRLSVLVWFRGCRQLLRLILFRRVVRSLRRSGRWWCGGDFGRGRRCRLRRGGRQVDVDSQQLSRFVESASPINRTQA